MNRSKINALEMVWRAWKKSNLLFNRIIASTTIQNSLCDHTKIRMKRCIRHETPTYRKIQSKELFNWVHKESGKKMCSSLFFVVVRCRMSLLEMRLFAWRMPQFIAFRIHVQKCCTSFFQHNKQTTSQKQHKKRQQKNYENKCPATQTTLKLWNFLCAFASPEKCSAHV